MFIVHHVITRMLQFYNTLTRQKDSFAKPTNSPVGLYTCGPTVYNYAHIGNLRTYIFEDILKRVLMYNGYTVNHVMNITDVGHLTDDADQGEDKMEKGARREGKTAWDIAAFYTEAFLKDIAALNILPATTLCRATDNIPEQIAMVQTLIDKGVTYETSDGIYFDTTKITDYGKLANLDKQQLKAGSRVDMGEKKNPHDFALWKFSPTHENRQMEWEAFGRMGFPGWHIECSAMSIKYLGEHFDIHCGGIDHVPVHHTNEIAQSETATGVKPWVDIWMHGEFLNIPKVTIPIINLGLLKKKMAKSVDNFLSLKKVVEIILNIKKKQEYSFDLKNPALVYRFWLLGAHYRKQMNFSEDAMKGALAGYGNLTLRVANIENSHQLSIKKPGNKTFDDYESDFISCINNDLDMPGARRTLEEMIKDTNLTKNKAPEEFKKLKELILKFDSVLGLGLEEYLDGPKEIQIPEHIQTLLNARAEARALKNWSESDRLRDEILANGFVVEDTASGQHLTAAPHTKK